MEKKVLMSVQHVSKQYPGTLALNDVSLDIYEGEVIGLIGENGAGKSTLMKIMIGGETATSGEITMKGQPFKPKNPLEANRYGIGMVFQEQSLILNLTVAQNIFIGREAPFTKHALVNKKAMNKAAQAVLDTMGIKSIHPGTRVNRLDFADRQMVEIAKVFDAVGGMEAKGGSIILLDEPTSVLSAEEIQQLFGYVRSLCAAGNAVIFVSHKLDEVMEIADRICVFKDGNKVAEMPNKDLDENILYEKMVGRTASGEYYHIAEQNEPGEEVVLELQNLNKFGYFGDINMQLHKGEIIGICGVVGSGKEELCAVICGDEDPTSGKLIVQGQERRFRSPQRALKVGILSVPRERRVESIISDMPVYENISMSNFDNVKNHGLISKKKEQAQAEEYRKRLEIKLPNVSQLVGRLSGGNAQKVVFARVLASNADILILDHPTRGVDVGAKAEIYSIIRDIARQGKSIIVLGDTLDESINLSNRVIVMKDGLITKIFDAPKDAKPSQVDIVKYMM